MVHDRIAVIDVETTGLSPWRNDRILEIGIVVISPEGETILEYDTLINPLRDIGPTRIHQITAADVINAPTFSDIAGDVLEILSSATLIAGHNVSFDKNFVVKEYERLGVSFPEVPLLCTCNLFGRSSLQACCSELGICFDGVAHRALGDARVTAKLVSMICAEDTSLLDQFRFRDVVWPRIPAHQSPRWIREQAREITDAPPRFLQRIIGQMPHEVEATPPDMLAYLVLIDRVLEDRAIDEGEEQVLVDAAARWNLNASQLDKLHKQYLEGLAAMALSDGVVTEGERRDLHHVARLLGQNDSQLDSILDHASSQLAVSRLGESASKNEVVGKRVCFTGELQCSIHGRSIGREMAQALATQAGCEVANSVTKKLDILVVADPNTQSGKAKKARDYGIRILAESVFWRMAGIRVD